MISEDDGAVTIEWTAPAEDGGSPITGYGYVVSTIPPSGDHLFDVAGAHEITPLSNCVPYAFFVRAVNDVGPGSFSDPVSGTPQCGV